MSEDNIIKVISVAVLVVAVVRVFLEILFLSHLELNMRLQSVQAVQRVPSLEMVDRVELRHLVHYFLLLVVAAVKHQPIQCLMMVARQVAPEGLQGVAQWQLALIILVVQAVVRTLDKVETGL